MNESLHTPEAQSVPYKVAGPLTLEALKSLLDRSPFLSVETKGLFVNVEKLTDSQVFKDFVGKIFQGGHYFTGLSYKNLVALLYHFHLIQAQYPRLRLADGLAPLLPRRLALYQGELVANFQAAEYDFTLSLDSQATVDQSTAASVTQEPPRKVDEFVAVMWQKGIRFGLDLEAVKQGLAIPKNQFFKLVVARAQMPQPGTDAKAEPLIPLEKDLRPMETREGGGDLHNYLCVFPQAKQGQVILRRIPPSAGVEGRDVSGEPIPAEAQGQDLDLGDLVGVGVVVTEMGNRQSLVAAQTGFVSVNPDNGAVSVTDDVINHTPVGIKTGNLKIEAERCFQFGGVSPGYVLEGRTIELKGGRVEGSVISRRGNISIEGDVVGGQVTAQAGDVFIKGKVMAYSRVEAYAGSVTLEQVENSLLIGRRVTAKRTFNTHVIAEQAEIHELEGTGVFCLSAMIERIVAHRPQKAGVALESGGSTLVIPIMEPPLRPAVIIQRTLEALTYSLPTLEAGIEKIEANEAVQAYLHALITYQTAKDEEQAAKAMRTFRSLEKRIQPVVERWRNMKEERQRILYAKQKLEPELQVWMARIDRLEEEVQGTMQSSVGSVSDANSFLKLYHDPRLPESFAEVAAMAPEQRKKFEALCLQILTAPALGLTKERLLPLNAPLNLSCRQMRDLLNEVEDKPVRPGLPPPTPHCHGTDNRQESRLNLLSPDDFLAYLGGHGHKVPPGIILLPVLVDEILGGLVADFSGLGAGILLDRRQKYSPAFLKGDKVRLEFSLGTVTVRLEMVVVTVGERGRMVRVGGFFVNLPPALQANIYKIKNALEARLTREEDRGKVRDGCS